VTRVLALLAGRGDLPRKIIAHCHKTQSPLYLIAFEGQTDPNLVDYFDEHQNGRPHSPLWSHLGAVGEILSYLKENNVTHIVMAGGMQRPAWSEIKFDWKGTQWFAKISLAKMGLSTAGDDGLLRLIESLLQEEGFEVVSSADILHNLLAPEGVLGSHQPDASDHADIIRGKEVAYLLGTADVGQSVVVQEGLVLGVEAIEGTENLLARCGTLRRGTHGGVLIKMAKPQQSRALDLPTIGINTINQVKAAGLKGIAVEAGMTQILDVEAVIKAADSAGLFLIGIQGK
jgi:UDP-2,3-diacylglucosamine hydrolase